MELKLPKKIEIGYMIFDITYNKESSGASFYFREREIIIGTLHLKKDPESVFMVICHEVMEIIHCMHNTRYMDESVPDNYKFFMDHKEFENNINMFSKVIQKFIK